MFGGVLAILIAIWVFRTAVQAKTGKVLLWTAGGALLFFVVQILFYNINIFIIDGLSPDIGAEYNPESVNLDDSKGVSGIQEGFGGSILGIIFEILPLLMAWGSVAFVRTKYMLKEELNVKNLTSGITGMFTGIKDSFKTN